LKLTNCEAACKSQTELSLPIIFRDKGSASMRPLTSLHALAQRHARRYDSQSCAFCVLCLLSRVFSAAAGLLASRTDFFVALPMAVESNACCLAAAWAHRHAACEHVNPARHIQAAVLWYLIDHSMAYIAPLQQL